MLIPLCLVLAPPPLLQGAIEKQVLSTVPSPPRVRFGTGKRPTMAVKTDAPGPGAYKTKPAIGAAAAVPVGGPPAWGGNTCLWRATASWEAHLPGGKHCNRLLSEALPGGLPAP
jgi:hypothetical protein